MPRWLWWLPLGVLTLVVALFVFRAGWIVANLSETDVIEHYAAIYVAEEGGKATMTDCTAVPGQGAKVWLVIRCGRHRVYPVDRFGRLIETVPEAGEPRS
jgi:hypothetical protein